MTAPPLARYFSDKENQGRGYIHPAHPDGVRVPGVTSITKLVAKDMAQWGADMAVRWISDNWNLWQPWAKSDERAYNSARHKHKEFRDERGEVGTGVHQYIDEWVKGEEPMAEFLDIEQQQMVQQFEEAVFITGMEFDDAELTLWGDTWAGTLDLRGTVYSERLGRMATAIFDVKTSKAIYPEVMIQLAALKSARTQFRQVENGTLNAIHLPDKKRGDSWWLEEDAPKVDTAFIIHLRGEFWDGKELVPAKWELIEIEHEELHLARFMALKDLWYANNAFKLAGVDLTKRLSA